MRLRPTSGPRKPIDGPLADAIVDLVGARVHIDITIPRTSIAARLRTVSRRELSEARAETRAYLKESGFPVDANALGSVGCHDEYQHELLTRILAVAIRDSKNTELALASLDDWRDCDDDQLEALWRTYEDHRISIDPIGAGVLTAAEHSAIESAAKKKDVDLLIGFGSRRLAVFLSTSVDPPAISATPMS